MYHVSTTVLETLSCKVKRLIEKGTYSDEQLRLEIYHLGLVVFFEFCYADPTLYKKFLQELQK